MNKVNKTQYDNIEIPQNLDEVVQGAVAEGLAGRRRDRTLRLFKRTGAVAAALLLCAVTALNVSPAFAAAACDLPVVGELCRVLLLREYHVEDSVKSIDTKIPQLENTGKSDLEARVNEEIQKAVSRCQADSEARAAEYYDAFVATGGNPEDFVPTDITIGYETKYVSPDYVSFVISQRESRFAAYNFDLYYNIDLNSGEEITLEDWFGADYREIVAGSIESTIAGWSEEQREILWEDLSVMDLISEDTSFYLNQEGEVVVVIEKYAATIGAAGDLEFTIQAPRA